jgi:ribosomal protein S27AE
MLQLLQLLSALAAVVALAKAIGWVIGRTTSATVCPRCGNGSWILLEDMAKECRNCGQTFFG